MRLIYVSNNVILPGEKQNPFFLQEKKWLLEQFNAFEVVSSGGIYRCENERDLKQYKKATCWDRAFSYIEGAFDAEVYKELRHMICDRKVTLKNVLKLFAFSVNTAKIHRMLRTCLKRTGTDDVVLYSYWLSFDAAAVAKIKNKYPGVYALARAHSYEIQLERNVCNPYLMKRFICENMDKVAFIAEDSRKRFCSYYKKSFPNACVQYLGSDREGTGYIARGKKDILTILTCSSIVPVKQLERMIEALSQWKEGSVHWIHIGDGVDGEKIRSLACVKLNVNPLVSYEFTGYMENQRVHERLLCEDIDVFVNCSRTEGVPVSIMEAMSVGLPVIAPKMFGIPELVRSGCGLLFEETEDASPLFDALKAFFSLSKEEREAMGESAYQQWQEHFCLQKNLQELFASVLKDC